MPGLLLGTSPVALSPSAPLPGTTSPTRHRPTTILVRLLVVPRTYHQSMVLPDHHSRPPVGRWCRLADATDGAGYLSVYYSEPLARYPIRHITRKADNKSDPNIETATFGLFSTCERQMRAKIVREGRQYLFFVTTRGQGHPGRALTGFYKLAWYTPSVGGAASGDFALAASEIRFVDPIPLTDLPEPARGVCLPRFRTIRPIDATIATALSTYLVGRPDRTEAYLSELKRIEQFAKHYTGGYTYPSWGKKDSFSWPLAARYLGDLSTARPLPKTSLSGQWRCAACQSIIESKAVLKACPVCGAVNSLQPKEE